MGFAGKLPLGRLMTPTGRLIFRVGCRMRPKPLGTFPRAFSFAANGSRATRHRVDGLEGCTADVSTQ